MLNTNEKYLKVNFLIQSIEEDIDEMIEKAMSLKQKKIIKSEILNKEDIIDINNINENIKLVSPYIETMEKELKEEVKTISLEDNYFYNENKQNKFEIEDEISHFKEGDIEDNYIYPTKNNENIENVFTEDDLVIPEKSVKFDEIYTPSEIIAKVYFFDGSERNIAIKNRKEIQSMFIKRVNKHSNLNNTINKSNERHKPVKKNKIKKQIEKVISFIKNIIKRNKK